PSPCWWSAASTCCWSRWGWQCCCCSSAGGGRTHERTALSAAGDSGDGRRHLCHPGRVLSAAALPQPTSAGAASGTISTAGGDDAAGDVLAQGRLGAGAALRPAALVGQRR